MDTERGRVFKYYDGSWTRRLRMSVWAIFKLLMINKLSSVIRLSHLWKALCKDTLHYLCKPSGLKEQEIYITAYLSKYIIYATWDAATTDNSAPCNIPMLLFWILAQFSWQMCHYTIECLELSNKFLNLYLWSISTVIHSRSLCHWSVSGGWLQVTGWWEQELSGRGAPTLSCLKRK